MASLRKRTANPSFAKTANTVSLGAARREAEKTEKRNTSGLAPEPFQVEVAEFDPPEMLSTLIEGTKGDFNVLDTNIGNLIDDVTTTLQDLVLRHYSTFLRLTDDMHDMLKVVRMARKAAIDTKVTIANLCDVTFDHRNSGEGLMEEDIVFIRRRQRSHRTRLIQRTTTAEGSTHLCTTVPDFEGLATAWAVAAPPKQVKAPDAKPKVVAVGSAGSAASASAAGKKELEDAAAKAVPLSLQAEVRGGRDELQQLIFARQYKDAVELLRKKLDDDKLGEAAAPGFLEFEPVLAEKLGLEIRRLPLSVAQCMHPPFYNFLTTLGRLNYAVALFFKTQFRWLQWELRKTLTVGSRREICGAATDVWLITTRYARTFHEQIFKDLSVQTQCAVNLWISACLDYLIDQVLVPQLLCLDQPIVLDDRQLMATAASSGKAGGSGGAGGKGTQGTAASNSASGANVADALTPIPSDTFIECMLTIADCHNKLKELARLGFPYTFSQRIIATAAVPLLLRQNEATGERIRIGLRSWHYGHPKLLEHRNPAHELVDAMTQTRNEGFRCAEFVLPRVGKAIEALDFGMTPAAAALKTELQKAFVLVTRCVWTGVDASGSLQRSKSSVPSASITFLELLRGSVALLLPVSEQRRMSVTFRTITDDPVLVEVFDASLQQLFRDFLTATKSAIESATKTIPKPREADDDDDAEPPFLPLDDLLDATAPLNQRLFCTPFIFSLLNDVICATVTLNFAYLFLKSIFRSMSESTGLHMDKLVFKAAQFAKTASQASIFADFEKLLHGDPDDGPEEEDEDVEAFMMKGNAHRLILGSVKIVSDALPSFSICRKLVNASGKKKEGVLEAPAFDFAEIDPADEAALFPLAVQFCVNTIHFLETLRFAGCDAVADDTNPTQTLMSSIGIRQRLKGYGKGIGATVARTPKAVGGSAFSDITAVYIMQTVLCRVFEAMVCEPEFWELVSEGGHTPSTSQVVLLCELIRAFFAPVLKVRIPILVDPPAHDFVTSCLDDYQSGSIGGKGNAGAAQARTDKVGKHVEKLMATDIIESVLAPDLDENAEIDEQDDVEVSLNEIRDFSFMFCKALL